MPLLYDGGVEHVAWVEGSSGGTGSVAKNADHLLAEATRSVVQTGDARRTWVTDAAVDLTDVNEVSIEWSAAGSGLGDRWAYFVVSDQKTGDVGAFHVRTVRTGAFARQTDTLDVSALTGSFFIRYHARVNTTVLTEAVSTVRAFRVETTGAEPEPVLLAARSATPTRASAAQTPPSASRGRSTTPSRAAAVLDTGVAVAGRSATATRAAATAELLPAPRVLEVKGRWPRVLEVKGRWPRVLEVKGRWG